MDGASTKNEMLAYSLKGFTKERSEYIFLFTRIQITPRKPNSMILTISQIDTR